MYLSEMYASTAQLIYLKKGRRRCLCEIALAIFLYVGACVNVKCVRVCVSVCHLGNVTDTASRSPILKGVSWRDLRSSGPCDQGSRRAICGVRANRNREGRNKRRDAAMDRDGKR
jgi:hypothetical protein